MVRRVPTTPAKVIQITYPQYYEELFSPAIPLPTTEPTDPQITFTVQESDFPSVNVNLESKVYIIGIPLVSYNTTSSAIAFYFKIIRNGTAVISSYYSNTAGNYLTIYCFYNVVSPGDVWGIKVWAGASGLNFVYWGRAIWLSRIKYMSKYVLKRYDFYPIRYPIATKGNPTTGYNPGYIYHENGANIDTRPNPITIYGWKQHGTYGLYRCGYGDTMYANSYTYTNDPSRYPYNISLLLPSKIIIYPIVRDLE